MRCSECKRNGASGGKRCPGSADLCDVMICDKCRVQAKRDGRPCDFCDKVLPPDCSFDGACRTRTCGYEHRTCKFLTRARCAEGWQRSSRCALEHLAPGSAELKAALKMVPICNNRTEHDQSRCYFKH